MPPLPSSTCTRSLPQIYIGWQDSLKPLPEIKYCTIYSPPSGIDSQYLTVQAYQRLCGPRYWAYLTESMADCSQPVV